MKFFTLVCPCGCQGPLLLGMMDDKGGVKVESIAMFRSQAEAQIEASGLTDDDGGHPSVG